MELNSVFNEESLIVWRGEYNFPDDEIDSVKENIISVTERTTPNGAVGELHSTFFINDVHQRPEFVLLGTYREIISQIAIDLNFSASDFTLDFWCQIYDGSHEKHMHYNGMIHYSFVHFIRPTEKKCFHFSGWNGEKYYPKQDKGDIIVFPSMAIHGIDESYGTERMTIAGNLAFTAVRTPGVQSWCRNKVVRDGLSVSEILEYDE